MTRIPIFLFFLFLKRITATLYDGSENVKVITKSSEFDEVLQSDGIWLVQFFAPWCGHCQQLKPSYDSLAGIVKGVFNVAAIDATSSSGKRIASKYGVTGFPSLFIFGADKTQPTKAEKRDPQSLVQALMDSTVKMLQTRSAASAGKGGGSSSSQKQQSSKSKRSSDKSSVVQLNAGNYQEKVLENADVVMVAFIAPWCGYCKQLLPEWEEAAAILQGQGAVLGVVDATAEKDLAAHYGVSGYPTIKYFVGGAPQKHSDAKDYQGERQANGIVKFALSEVDRTGIPKPVEELVSQAVLDETCGGLNRICVLTALPHILETGADGRNSKRDMLSRLQKAHRPTFSFLWFEGGSQPELEETLEMTFGYPAVVAISLERKAYAVLRSSVSERNLSKFLLGITTGGTPTTKLRTDQLPAVKTIEPWDGKNGAPIEEELSLAEIMGWDEDEEGKEL